MMKLEKFKYKRLDEICSKVTDGTHDSPKRKEKGRFLVTSKHIKGRSIDYDNAYLISEEDYTKINMRSKVDQWDVLISMIGEYCGFCYIERNCEIDYAVKNVGILKAGDKETAEWIYYYLNSPEGRNELYQRRSGTSQPYLSLKTLREFPVKFFENPTERGKITKQLSALDDKIELNNQMNQTLEEMAQAVFKEWFMEFNFLNENRVPYKENGGEMEESELGMIPKGWKVGEIRKFIKFIKGKKPKNISEKRKDKQQQYLTIKSYTGSEKIFADIEKIVLTNEKEIVMVMDGASSGTIFSGKSGIVASTIAKIQTTNLNTDFLYYLLKYYESDIKKHLTGSAIPHTDKEFINRIKLAYPVNKFNYSFFTNIREKISLLNEENQTLIKTRDTLLPKLMSREVRV